MSGIVILGSSNTDMVLYVPEIPKPGQTVRGKNFTINGGGKGANQAVATSRAVDGNCYVYFIACVGSDSFAENSKILYKENGINTDYIFTIDGQPSGSALIFVADSGENTIGISSGANAMLSEEYVERSKLILQDADYLLTQLESPLESIQSAFKIAHESGTKIILNPAPAVKLPSEVLSIVDYITPNQSETQFYTGIMPVDEGTASAAAAEFHRMGIEHVVITMGSQGAYYSSLSVKKMIPARKVEPVDTVAAGDTFNGAFVAGMAMGKSEVDALIFASTAAALAVTRKGAQISTPYYKEIINF